MISQRVDRLRSDEVCLSIVWVIAATFGAMFCAMLLCLSHAVLISHLKCLVVHARYEAVVTLRLLCYAGIPDDCAALSRPPPDQQLQRVFDRTTTTNAENK